jgi:hypothetical protein
MMLPRLHDSFVDVADRKCIKTYSLATGHVLKTHSGAWHMLQSLAQIRFMPRAGLACLPSIETPAAMQDRRLMAEVMDNMNARHTNAQMAGRASIELHTLVFFRGKITLADARVVRVMANGMIVFVPKFGIEGPVFFGEKKGKREDAVGAVLNEARQVSCCHSFGSHLIALSSSA